MSAPVALAALPLPDHAAGARGTVADALADQARDARDAQAREAERAAARAAELEQAYRRGRDEAGQELAAQAGAALAALAAAAAQVAADAPRAVAEQVAADADTVLAVAGVLAGWVLGRELAADPGALLPVVSGVLDAVVDPARAVLAVHPDAQDAAVAWAARLGAQAPQLRPDPDLAPGAARLHTADGGVAEVSVAEALRRALEALQPAPGRSR